MPNRAMSSTMSNIGGNQFRLVINKRKMKRVYLKLILISCFVFSGTTKGIAQDDFQERQRNTKLEHYKKWLSSKAREVFFTNRRSEEHTSELQSRENLVCRLLLEKKKKKQ